MFETLSKIFAILTRQERKQARRIFFAMIIMAAFDVVGVASIMPFMAVVTNPSAIEHNVKLSMIYHGLHFHSPYHFIIFLGMIVFVLCVLGNVYTMLTTWLILRFANLREYTLSKRLLTKYLNQPYSFFLNRNTSELGKNILSEVSTVTTYVLIPGMDLIAKSIVTTFVVSLLFLIDPALAITMMIVLGGVYTCIYTSVKSKLGKMSEELIYANQGRFKISSEALSGIKDIKLLNNENVFLDQFSIHASKHAHHKAFTDVISLTPRYALEAIASGGILSIVFYLVLTKNDVSSAISYVSLYAFASYRLMPALQQIFVGVTRIRVHRKATDLLYQDLMTNQTDTILPESDKNIQILPFNNKLELKNISFYYTESKQPVVNDLSLIIPAKSCIGFVGSTGSGKTTTIDLILGLLHPQQGNIAVDDVILTTENMKRWQKNLGYVPQSIYLADNSIAKNIAFGVPDDKINMDAVINAAKIANIHEFVMTELPQTYDTVIGERGVRLSGGQRQRIGIARALYHDPEILVLDEATSALDGLTESSIMDAIQLLATKKTIIIVAHRLTTVKKCEKIYFFEKGVITSEGTFQQLCHFNEKFKIMADVVTA